MYSVIQAPDERLRVKTKPVKKITEKHQKIIKDMIKLAKSFHDPEGVGLASTQVGLDEQYFVLKHDDGSFEAVFNPQIVSYSKRTKKFFEGCLSIPQFWGEVERPVAISVKFQNGDGQEIKKRLKGLDAWIFQHEFDHLQGRLYMDLVMEQKGKLYKVAGKDRAGADVFEQVPL
ncbi:peptide deformylase [Candidatus Daviesbacteria bacterium]|nr:peptide deformylase [Candidatus Daviesbacteria bacterium]